MESVLAGREEGAESDSDADEVGQAVVQHVCAARRLTVLVLVLVFVPVCRT